MRGAVHLFAIDSDGSEPDGNSADSRQAAWLRDTLATSTARWQVVYMHHPPYSSSSHGSAVEMQWPYAQWGAEVVMAGHDHSYERIDADGITYIVNGLGGAAELSDRFCRSPAAASASAAVSGRCSSTPTRP